MLSRYQAIVVGAGHNGLVTAAYLARKGLKVAVFEKRPVVGGCAVTEQTWPGCRISSLSYVQSLFLPQIERDLKLSSYGYQVLPRDPASFTPFPDGRYLLLGPDKQLNHREISKFSGRDAEAFPRYEAKLDEMAEVLEPLMRMVPPDLKRMSTGQAFQWGRFLWSNRKFLRHHHDTLLRFMTGAASDLLDEWFESEQLKVTLATDAVIGANASPKMPGTAYVLFHHVMGQCNGVRGVWGYVRGGMGSLSTALADACKDLGVDVFVNKGIAKIPVRDGRVQGIVTEDGDEVLADVVVTNTTPHVTFRRLVDAEAIDPEFLRAVDHLSYDSASVKLNFVLSELPNFTACPGINEPGPQHRGTIHICPDLDYIERAYADSVAQKPSQAPILEATIPSSLDDSLAPKGQYVMNMFTQYGPYQLADGLSWDQERDAYMERCIDVMTEYAPNFRQSIIHKQCLTPLDLEREYDLTGGSIFHGRMSLDQLFHMRPVPGYADYRTPVQGLYNCGSSTHPGGGVMGACGLNAAEKILRDRLV